MTTPANPSVIEEIERKIYTDNIYGNKIILYNDEVNSFEHVEDCLMRICHKTKKEAKKIALEAHNNGRAICYKGSLEECETVADKMLNEHLTVTLE